ncbi:hypothetical protein TK50_04895 [Micromonospora haikouensis]|uniref:Uncharacterized protein n=1 Tax=Micromonospora haikouensis TaxID=686309 RepID=A0A0D0X188_9ACTN|nr:hypothetical protein TK50_04895 [Micromonospora haikouensis]
MLAFDAGAATFGGFRIRDELVLRAGGGDVEAALEPECTDRHLDGAALDGEGGREYGLGVVPAVEIEVRSCLAAFRVGPAWDVDGVDRLPAAPVRQR